MVASSNPYIRYCAGNLFCEEVCLRSVAERYGTPVYIYSHTAIQENFRKVRNDLTCLPSVVCYSVKANSNLSILALLNEAGAGFDVVSGGELERVLRVHGNPSKIVFSGVGKTQPEIDAALNASILMFNVESAGELELIGRRAQALGRRARVSIRINPDVEAATHPYISTGQTIHKFGVPKPEAIELYRLTQRDAHFEACGIACHIGSQILDEQPFIQAFEEIKDLADQLRAEGLALQWLDLGGGFGIRYGDEEPLNFARLAQELSARLRETPYRLVIEPGRSIVGDAGLLVTRVLYVKHNERKNFIVVDSGMNDLLRPTLYGSFHEIVPLRQDLNGQIRADVVGPICETGDFLAQDRELAAVKPGDLLGVLTAGAYGYVLASNYNSRARPAEIMVHGASTTLIRERETVEDLMKGERL
jgi:diaminopimelate decarboxylase